MKFCKYKFILLCIEIFLISLFSSCAKQQASTETSESLAVSSNTVQSDVPTYGNTEENGSKSNNIDPVNESFSSTETAENKVLIAYFSLADSVPEGADAVTHATPSIGNTESAAIEIQKQTGGDLFAIHTVESYPISHRECSEAAEEEMRSDARPELSSHIENMENYDTVYIGYPIWWYQEPMAIRTFLEEYDFSEKTVIPFCTTLGAGVKESEENIQSLCPNSTVLNGLTLYSGQDNFSDEILKWLSEIEMIK